jgi:hypothetical protein
VSWGTGKLPVLAGGETLGQVDVAFASCARVDWPEESVEVEAEVQCVDGDSQVVADVRNRGGVAWRGALLRSHAGQHGDEADVPADGTVRLVLPGPGTPLHDSVTVRLTREFEGVVHTVERSHDVRPTTCEPPVSCKNAEPTSWFTAWFGRRCPEEDGNQADERIEQATFSPRGFWSPHGYGA